MMLDRQALLTEYLSAVSAKAHVESRLGGAVLATAELLSDGTRATVWVRWSDYDIHVHDNGYCTDHLATLGFNIYGSDQRRTMIGRICEQYGVRMDKGVLKTACAIDELGASVLRIAGAIHSVTDLIYTKQAYHEGSSLQAEVVSFVRTRVRWQINHNPKIKGHLMTHPVDLAVVNGRPNYVRVISGSDIAKAVYHWVFTYSDVRRVDRDCRMFVLYDPRRDQWREPIRSIVGDYSDGSFSWDDREQFVTCLAGRPPSTINP